MAVRKLNINAKIKASTVLEVIVSMVIIITVFGIAMMIYANVSGMSLSEQKINAQAILAQIIKNTPPIELSGDQESIIGGFTVERSVRPYAENQKLLQVDLKAYDENHRLLAELHQLISADDSQ